MVQDLSAAFNRSHVSQAGLGDLLQISVNDKFKIIAELQFVKWSTLSLLPYSLAFGRACAINRVNIFCRDYPCWVRQGLNVLEFLSVGNSKILYSQLLVSVLFSLFFFPCESESLADYAGAAQFAYMNAWVKVWGMWNVVF